MTEHPHASDARRDTESDLTFDVQMGLRNAPLRKGADARMVAKRIVEHLKLCGWRWRRKEPDEAHGSFKPKAENQGGQS